MRPPLMLGQRATLERVFTPDDLRAYAALTARVAPAAPPSEATVPEPLIGALFSCLLGTALPGRGTNYLKQRLTFHAPARVGERLTATVEIVRLRPEKALVNLRTTCLGDGGRLICEGEALVLAKDVPGAFVTSM
ncbi:hypothetical protein [Kallotenue papyrolyticum]|uniref:hypothetical protein n=1 Tax=Kallotenue papyrolyticum TaxID=1325125 RepID=UPI000471F70E|nr:hypothetical protein [Kallotenue papyrolyticum]